VLDRQEQHTITSSWIAAFAYTIIGITFRHIEMGSELN
jgi:hypothetical protein